MTCAAQHRTPPAQHHHPHRVVQLAMVAPRCAAVLPDCLITRPFRLFPYVASNDRSPRSSLASSPLPPAGPVKVGDAPPAGLGRQGGRVHARRSPLLADPAGKHTVVQLAHLAQLLGRPRHGHAAGSAGGGSRWRAGPGACAERPARKRLRVRCAVCKCASTCGAGRPASLEQGIRWCEGSVLALDAPG